MELIFNDALSNKREKEDGFSKTVHALGVEKIQWF
jgi:hypothetical protein